MPSSTIGPNNGQGRPKGASNHATRELKEFWHGFFSSAEYRVKAQQRILNGEAPSIEAYLLALIYGKPRETLDVNVSFQDELATLSTEELALRADVLRQQLHEAAALEAAIDAECRVEEVG